MILIIQVFLFNCQEEEIIRGLYFEPNSFQFYEFESEKLSIYNVRDSIELQYNIKYKNEYLLLRNDNENLQYHFNQIGDSIELSKCDKTLNSNCLLKLGKIDNEKVNLKDLYDIYWINSTYSIDSLEYLLRIPSKNFEIGYTYKKVKNNNEGAFYNDNDFYFKNKFNVEYFEIFDKFLFIQLNDLIFDFRWLYVESLSSSELKFRDLETNKIITFRKYNEPNIVGFDSRFMEDIR